MLLHTLMITYQSSPKLNKNIPKILVIKLMIQEKKKGKVRDVPSFYWLSRYLVYYLCMNKCVNTMLMS